MRTLILVCIFLMSLAVPVSAEEPNDPDRVMESITDFGGAIPLRGRWHHDVLGRVVLSSDDGRDAAEAFYGIGWTKRRGVSFALMAGYGYHGGGHGPMLTVRKTLATRDMRWRMEFESYLRYAGGWSNEGYYAFDWKVGGFHVANDGTDVGLGAHLGSGHGLLPFRFEMRHTVGLTDGMPDLVSAFVMSIDLR